MKQRQRWRNPGMKPKTARRFLRRNAYKRAGFARQQLKPSFARRWDDAVRILIKEMR